MSEDAQSALRRTMELYTRVTRFCLICNYVSRIIEPLASRCAKFRFQPLSSASFSKKIVAISASEGLTLQPGALDTLVNVSKGDMRTGITLLQSSAQYNQRSITSESIVETAGIPPQSVIASMWAAVASGKAGKLVECADDLRAEGYSLRALVRILQEELVDKEADPAMTDLGKAHILMKIAKVDKAIEDGANEDLQLRSLLATCMQQRLLATATA